eukprot:203751_1
MSTKTTRSRRNKRNKRKRDTQPESVASNTIAMEFVDENSKEIESDLLDNESIREPPKKKRKTEARSLSICNDINTRNIDRNQMKHRVHNSWKLHDIKQHRAQPMEKDDAFHKLKANNNLLTKQVIEYREEFKSYEKKCKALRHENGSFRKLTKSLNEREKRMKKQHRNNQEEITELKLKIEEIGNELNSNKARDSNHDKQIMSELNHKINEMEYDCARWKAKYNHLLSTSDRKA